jgi:hypothetical protein
MKYNGSSHRGEAVRRSVRNSRSSGSRALVTFWLSLLIGCGFVVGAAAAPATSFPSLQLKKEVAGEEAIGALGQQLPEVAAYYRKTADELRQLLRSDHALKLDRSGRLFYVCDWKGETNAPTAGQAAEGEAAVAALVPYDQTFHLHSRPGATKTIYLDFGGFTISGTAWNTSNNNGNDIVAPPWDTDGNPDSFGTNELTAIQRIWLRVSEDYSPYKVDVTTEYNGEAVLTRSSSSDQVYGVRALVSAIGDYFGDPGGIAYVGVFDSTGDRNKPALIFPENLGNSEKNIAEAISHEVGHTLGLSHDGTTSGSTYYSGQGNWAPIMGVGYSKPITQWSKGEYSSANNTQDDLTIITQNGLSYRDDDFGNTIATARALGTGTITTNGVIERTGDKDFFAVQSGTGTFKVTVTPFERGANLHLFVTLYDGNGLAVTNREVADTSAGAQPVAVSRSVTGGTYYVSVQGNGSGDPLTTGYSAYASLGQYTVAITAPVATGAIPRPLASLGRNGATLNVQVASVLGATYVLQTATNLSPPVIWQNYSTNAGNGGTLSIAAPSSTAAVRRFLRLFVY